MSYSWNYWQPRNIHYYIERYLSVKYAILKARRHGEIVITGLQPRKKKHITKKVTEGHARHFLSLCQETLSLLAVDHRHFGFCFHTLSPFTFWTLFIKIANYYVRIWLGLYEDEPVRGLTCCGPPKLHIIIYTLRLRPLGEFSSSKRIMITYVFF